ncbi:MAG: hypothetical protein ACYDGN_09640 [Acidimicrobiales bacterium]
MAAHLRPAVTLEGGKEASGLATMVAELVRQNFADSKARAMVASRARGDVGLTAADHDLSITLSFLGSSLNIADRSKQARPAVPTMSGDWLELAHLCSGQQSPLAAWRAGRVGIDPHGHRSRLAAAAFVLSAPPTDQDAARRRRRRRRRAVIVASFIAGLVAGGRRASSRVSR